MKTQPIKRVLFACVHNTGRSQMAEAFFNHLADPNKAQGMSAGTTPATEMNSTVLSAMKEVGIDLVAEGHHPKLYTLEIGNEVERVISMGCGVELACPAKSGGIEDWGLDDPKGQSIEKVREIRDEIRRRVAELIEEMGTSQVKE